MLVDSVLHSQSEDAADFGTDVISATGNAEETHQCLRKAEIRYRPKVYFVRKKPEGLRMILVDRLIGGQRRI